MEHVAARRKGTDDLDLHTVESRDLVRRIAMEVRAVRGVRLRDRTGGKVDFVEIAIFHAPEHVAPGFVQGGDGAVALLQPMAETEPGFVRVGQHRVVAAIFIVRLPRDDGRMLAEALGKRTHDSRTFAPVARMGKAVMPSRAEAARAPVPVDRQHVGHGVDEPFGRRRCRRAEDDLQPFAMERVQRAAEPVEIVMTGGRLEPRPGELTYADAGNARLAHAPRILRPHRLRPVLWVVADADRDIARIRASLRHGTSLFPRSKFAGNRRPCKGAPPARCSARKEGAEA